MKKSIKEYGGKEKYASKAAMAKHEKKEGAKMEMKEKSGKTMTGAIRGYKLKGKK
jgi:hypothetical protein